MSGLAAKTIGFALESQAGRAAIDGGKTSAINLLDALSGTRLSQAAQEAYTAKDWTLSKSLYERVISEGADAGHSAVRQAIPIARLARADFHLGNLPQAESGFLKYLSSRNQAEPLRASVFEELGSIYARSGRAERVPLMNAHVQGLRAELPDFSALRTRLTVPKDYEPSKEALMQMESFREWDMLKSPFARGYTFTGVPRQFADEPRQLYSVIDNVNDPAQAIASAKIKAAFVNLEGKPTEHATAMAEYTARLFQPAKGNAVDLVHAFRDVNLGERIFMGEWMRNGLGICSQQAHFIKSLADLGGYQSTLYSGWSKGAFHEVSTIAAGNGAKEKVFDSSMRIIGRSFENLIGKVYTANSWAGRWAGREAGSGAL